MMWMVLLVVLGDGPEWSPLTRDVYVDGEIRRSAMLWGGEDGAYVLVSPESEQLITLFSEDGVWVAARGRGRGFTVAGDGKHARGVVKPVGERVPVRVIESRQWLFALAGKTVLISGHRNQPGPLAGEEAIYALAPQWRVLRDHAEPDERAVEVLASVDTPVTLKVYFATWCGDSRRDVPELLAALAAAGNPRLGLELIGVGNGFTEPAELLAGDRITNVPTIIAIRDGEELGRIIERPINDSVTEDLAALLRGSYTVTGAPDGPVVARGEWVRRDGDGRLLETERWQLSRRKEGGHRLMSRIEGLEQASEVLLSTDAEDRPTFLQITRDGEAHRRRTRIYHRGSGVSLTTRGSDVGVIRQSLGAVGPLRPVTPSMVINGWIAGRFPEAGRDLWVDTRAQVSERLAMTVTEVFHRGRSGRHLARLLEGDGVRWVVHAGTGLPLAARRAGEIAEMTVFFLEPGDQETTALSLPSP